MKAARPEWSGRTVVCIASGPSLTAEDCEAVRASGHPVIVTNTTFRLCPWADVLFAFDGKWWKEYHEEVKATFKGRMLSAAQIAPNFGAESTFGAPWFTAVGNSGVSAISLAISGKAKKIVLLGFDCQKTGGRVHWHGDHPGSLSNAKTIMMWPKQFDIIAGRAKAAGIPVVNSTRQTVLKCFPRVDLAEALQ